MTQLKNKRELEWSAIVANNSMNRKRGATGINSYEKDVKLNPIEFLETRMESESVRWMDLCCGEANALVDAAAYFVAKGASDKISLEGIDLVDYFNEECSAYGEVLTVTSMNLEDWMPDDKYDLITIVHGLHYVGDKLTLIRKAANSLSKNGLLIANLDLRDIKLVNESDSVAVLKSYFKEESVDYNAKAKMIRVRGTKNLAKRFDYVGADDEVGPNYTGQPVVQSVYQALS